MSEIIGNCVLAGLAYFVWCWAGFAVTDRVIGHDRFFQWAASCGAMGYLYAALWPVWIVYYLVRR